MGEMVECGEAGVWGYLASPAEPAPGVLVIQEWWGLVDHIKDVAERFAAEGFCALAPDLYHGKTTKEPDEAGKLMMELDMARAADDMGVAFDYLSSLDAVKPKKVGAVGFCMGGSLAILLSTVRPASATVSFYGAVPRAAERSKIRGPLLMHAPEHDDPDPSAVEAFVSELKSNGVDAAVEVYPGQHHAFFNDTRPEVYDEASANRAWERTISFFKQHLA